MKQIGIVACSAEGAALCYRTIALEGARVMGPHDHPEVSLHNHSLAQYMSFIYVHDWNGVAELMLSSAEKLEKTGADFLICPDNTIHQALPLMRERSPLPWLHIAEVVTEQAVERGFHKIGITGTKYLTDSDVYPTALAARSLAYARPTPEERDHIDRIIMDELVYGVFKPEAVSYFQKVIGHLKSQGCDAVVLGCTEIPLLMNDSNSPLPTLDSTRLLARAAVKQAMDAVAAEGV